MDTTIAAPNRTADRLTDEDRSTLTEAIRAQVTLARETGVKPTLIQLTRTIGCNPDSLRDSELDWIADQWTAENNRLVKLDLFAALDTAVDLFGNDPTPTNEAALDIAARALVEHNQDVYHYAQQTSRGRIIALGLTGGR